MAPETAITVYLWLVGVQIAVSVVIVVGYPLLLIWRQRRRPE